MVKFLVTLSFAITLTACSIASPAAGGGPAGQAETAGPAGTTPASPAPAVQAATTQDDFPLPPATGEQSEENTSPTPQPLSQEAIDSCPVTPPNGKSPPSDANAGFNLANQAETLFTIPWPAGMVLFTPNGPGHISPDGSLEMKWPWYRTVPGEVIIGGRRLDAESPPMPEVILRGEPDGYGDTGFHPSGLVWPGEGCWEVTARVGQESLTFVTLVIRIPFDPLAPQWLPEGLVLLDRQVHSSPWSVQDIYRSTDGGREVILETTQVAPENPRPYPEETTQQYMIHGQPGVCAQGSLDEAGNWQAGEDGAILEWQAGELNYRVRSTGLGISCEDLSRIAGP